MIKMYDQVPQVYNKASRDFQYLSCLIDIVLNYVKHNIDSIYQLPNSKADPMLTELLAMTLGFKVKRNYNREQLIALVEVLPSILKHKGTNIAVEIAGEALVRITGVTGVFSCEMKNGVLEITFPQGLIDIALFTDLLPYILPAGLTCKIIRRTELLQNRTVYYDVYNTTYAKWYTDVSNRTDPNEASFAEIYDPGVDGIDNITFANFRTIGDDNILNAGLKANAVVPSLVNETLQTEPIVTFSNTEPEEES